MELAHSTIQQNYIKQVRALEARVEKATEGDVDLEALDDAQKKLDLLAEKYQDNEKIGTSIYKLYELQAAIHYFNGNDAQALDFINAAIETRGTSYPSAEKLKARLHEGGTTLEDVPPLELQALIKSQRTSAIIMAVISMLSFYFIPWGIFYIYFATKLKPEKAPDRGLVKTAAIVTLPLCFAIVPLILDFEFWRMNKKLKEYEQHGAKAFMTNKEWREGEPKRKRGRRIALAILLSIVAFLVALILIAAFYG